MIQISPGARRVPAVLAAAGFAAATAGASALGGLATGRTSQSPWYRALRKPRWQPPPQAFPIVWTSLYATIAASGYRVWRAPRSGARDRALKLWAAQLALNAAWSPLFFRLRRPRVALADAGGLVAAVAAYVWAARRADRTAGWLVAPYLGWSAFAFALNASIVSRNAGTLARR